MENRNLTLTPHERDRWHELDADRKRLEREKAVLTDPDERRELEDQLKPIRAEMAEIIPVDAEPKPLE